MENIIPTFKEVYISKISGNWTEITVNTGGIPSTLQDIKAQQRSSGYAYKNHNNRFIYWRTTHDVLELLEESLDVNLCNNQIRYTFTDSPILEGVTVIEVHNSVVVLVPTLCSVHRLTFPHPDQYNKKGSHSGMIYSIFHGASDSDGVNPATYHVLNNIPSCVVSGACCLAVTGEAVFALSMKNSDILLVFLEAHNGIARVITLTRNTAIPRFIYGLSGFLGKEANNKYMSTSMVFHIIERELYLFSLEMDGQLRAWNCENATSTSLQVFHSSDPSSQSYKLCKGFSDDNEVLLAAFYQGCISIIKPFKDYSVKLSVYSNPINTPENLTLVDMVFGCGNEVWCSWTTSHDSPMVTKIDMSQGGWSQVVLAKPTTFEYPSGLTLDPAQTYLDKIMNCGFCSTQDLIRTLSVLKSDRKIENNGDLREQIRIIVDSEIYAETIDMEMDDADFLTVSERLWSRLYRCCIQYLSTALAVSGLVWLPSSKSLALIKLHGYSLVRSLTPLEMAHLWMPTLQHPSDRLPYRELVNVLKKCDVPKAIDKIELGLHVGDSLDSYLEASLEFLPKISISDFDRDCNAPFTKLLDELVIEEISRNGADGEGFTSEAGISAVVATFEETCSLRLKVCESACLLLKSMEEENSRHLTIFKELCQLYKKLVWVCQTPVPGHRSIIRSYFSLHPSLGQANLLDTVHLLLQTIWPLFNSEAIAAHLMMLKRYDLVQTYANQIDFTSWEDLYIESYLATGEPHKAYNLILSSRRDISTSLKAISLLERYGYPDYIISLVDNLNLNTGNNISHSDIETLYSIKFVHELRLGHYDSAYACIRALPDPEKKTDFLHRFVLDLIANSRYDLLTSFSFAEHHLELERLLTIRSRSLDVNKCQVFYTLLYSLHIKNNNFKKAASVMYEQSLRVETSEAQWKCLGISYNALKCLRPLDAFIVKPTGSTDPNEDSIEIVEAEDMRKELELAKFRFYLGCSPEETVTKLVSRCIGDRLFTKALHLATLFNLDRTLIMEAFTAEVVHLVEPNRPFKWLSDNNDDHTEHTIVQRNAVKVSWRLLQYTLEKYERPCETLLHRAVTTQLLRMRCFLPVWLINSYKKKNGGELLRLYLSFGDLESGSVLAVDYLNAAMGVGYEEFGLPCPLGASTPPIYTPLYTIDLLLRELHAKQKGEELESVLSKYVEFAKRASEDKVRIAQTM